MRGLAGTIAVVSGGSQGIGQAIASELARHSVRVVILDIEAADETLSVLEETGTAGWAFQTDVTDSGSVAGAAREVRLAVGEPDFLVNNAGGIIQRRLLLNMSESLWHQTLALNLTSAFHLVKEFAPAMIERRRGSIVNITATSVRFVWPGATHYQVAKAGLAAFTRSTALEFGPAGVRVNCVSPGTVETPRVAASFRRQPADALEEREATALGRVGRPDDVASVVAFLLSAEAKYVTGVEVACDGGYSLTGQRFERSEDGCAYTFPV
jgi:NAD(P)-dependent dehydrogenase (short-subunit alcohol dehydrogenase family)